MFTDRRTIQKARKAEKMNINNIVKIILHIITFSFSFYCLSGLDLSKLMLNRPDRGAKGFVLLFLMSMGLGYLAAQFLIAIMYSF